MKLFVAGEGVGEIGKWAEQRERRSTSKRGDGVLKTLFDTRREGTVIDGRRWMDIVAFVPGSRGDGKTLAKAVVLAEDAGAEILLWSRDTDGDPDRVRELEVSLQALRDIGVSVEILGGVQNPCLESWIVAIAQLDAKPDERSKKRLADLVQEHGFDTELTMCELIRSKAPNIDTSRSPSLAKWMAQL